MIKGQSIIAIVPARAGSKGLVNKNLKKLNGIPLVAWSINAGLNSRFIDKVVVSTDSLEIQEVAINYGAESPILRPKDLASDESQTHDAVDHMLTYYKNELNEEFDFVVLLEPTSPLRTFEDIDNSIQKLANHKIATSLVGVGKCEAQHPDFLVRISDDGIVSSLSGQKVESKRRQEITDVFFLDGSIYISKVSSLNLFKSFYQQYTLAFEFPKWKNFEIDDSTDFLIVEKLLENEARL